MTKPLGTRSSLPIYVMGSPEAVAYIRTRDDHFVHKGELGKKKPSEILNEVKKPSEMLDDYD